MPRRIVVVEDEADVRDLLHDVLLLEGYEVRSFGHPLEAVSEIPAYDPDLLLLDLMLPVMNGVELAAMLRESGYSETAMIAMSASQVMLDEARESHLFQDTIAKPFDIDTVLDRIRAARA